MHDKIPPAFQAVVGFNGEQYCVAPLEGFGENFSGYVICYDNMDIIKALLAFFNQDNVKEYYASLKK